MHADAACLGLIAHDQKLVQEGKMGLGKGNTAASFQSGEQDSQM